MVFFTGIPFYQRVFLRKCSYEFHKNNLFIIRIFIKQVAKFKTVVKRNKYFLIAFNQRLRNGNQARDYIIVFI